MVCGVLVWYEEQASWLSAHVASLKGAIDHLIAVDGAYALFPGGRGQSGAAQHEALVQACAGAGVGLTLHVPVERWFGNEVEKRSFAFALAEGVTEPEDWYFVLDADELVHALPFDFRDRLEATEHDAAEVTFFERRDFSDPKVAQLASEFNWPREYQYGARRLFRAVRGLRCAHNHYTYETPDGTRLYAQQGHQIDAEGIPELRVEHRTAYRPKARSYEQEQYYLARDRTQAETVIPEAVTVS